MKERTVAIYARVSTEHEAQLSALENQVQYYDDILAKHPEWKLCGRYIDEGITGTSTKKRKNFMKMMDDAARGCFDLIITREVSRFARNTVDTLQETRKLKKLGIEVWFTEDNIWTMNDEDGELRLTIMATLAQNESKKTSLRVKAGQMVSFKNATPYGNGNILGYDKLPNKGGFVINKDQADTVKRIFELYLQGEGTRKITYILEQEGRKTAMGLCKWDCANIRRILNNAFYCGTIVYRKQYVPDYLEQKKINNHGEIDQVVVEGNHEPIISKEMFEKVQEIFQSKTFKNKEDRKLGYNPPTSIWSKKLECYCGSHYNRRVWNRHADGSKIFAYQCRSTARHGTKQTRINKGLSVENVCEAPMIQEWKLGMMAQMIFEQFWENKQEVLAIADQILDKTINFCNDDGSQDKINSLESQYERNKRKLDNLMEMRLAEEVSREYFLEKKAELEKILDDIKAKIADIKGTADMTEDDLQKQLTVFKYALEQNFQFDKYNVPETVLDAFVRKIVVHKDHFEWYLTFSEDVTKCLVKGTGKNTSVELINLPTQIDSGTGCYCQ